MKKEFRTKLSSINTSVYKYHNLDSKDIDNPIVYDDIEIFDGTLIWNVNFEFHDDSFDMTIESTFIELQVNLIVWNDETGKDDIYTKTFSITDIKQDLDLNNASSEQLFFTVDEVSIDLSNESALVTFQ